MRIIAMTLWAIGILLSLLAIIKIVQDIEIAIGLITISFGILALIWTTIARRNLSPGSTLRSYTNRFLTSLLFILVFSIWHTLSRLFFWEKEFLYPEYAFITMAYIFFVVAAYQILNIGKEFGFREQAKKINRIIERKKKR